MPTRPHSPARRTARCQVTRRYDPSRQGSGSCSLYDAGCDTDADARRRESHSASLGETGRGAEMTCRLGRHSVNNSDGSRSRDRTDSSSHRTSPRPEACIVAGTAESAETSVRLASGHPHGWWTALIHAQRPTAAAAVVAIRLRTLWMKLSTRQLPSRRAAVLELWQGRTLSQYVSECQGTAERLTRRHAARAQAERPRARASNNCCSRDSSVEFSPGLRGIRPRKSICGYGSSF
jgi:hypothetical protein